MRIGSDLPDQTIEDYDYDSELDGGCKDWMEMDGSWDDDSPEVGGCEAWEAVLSRKRQGMEEARGRERGKVGLEERGR